MEEEQAVAPSPAEAADLDQPMEEETAAAAEATGAGAAAAETTPAYVAYNSSILDVFVSREDQERIRASGQFTSPLALAGFLIRMSEEMKASAPVEEGEEGPSRPSKVRKP